MYTIDDLAAAFGIKRSLIHSYVKRGVLPRPAGARRGPGAYYTDEHYRILRTVRKEIHDRVTMADLAERRRIEAELRG